MLSKNNLFILLILLITIACFSAITPVKSVSIKQADTIVSPHLKEKTVSGTNILYCSTFQMAWNELKTGIIKEDIKLKNQPAMVNILNKGNFPKKELSENSYVAMAGYGKENIIKKINAALKSKFGFNAPKVKDKLNPLDIIAYSYLYKNLRFNPAFESIETPVKFNSDKNVDAFGINSFDEYKHSKLINQLSIPYFKNSDEFIVKLSPKSSNDEIFLAKIKPQSTLEDTLKYAQTKLMFSKQVYFNEHDTLQIPKFDFKTEHSFDELLNKLFLNKNFKDYYISKAIQNIDFKLNEKGAILKSEAKIIMELTAMPSSQPKQLIFNKPFLIYLKEKQAKNPYLVIWVENAELLVKK